MLKSNKRIIVERTSQSLEIREMYSPFDLDISSQFSCNSNINM